MEYRPTPVIDEHDQITDEGMAWLNEIVNLYIRNCMALSVMRGEPTVQCRRGIDAKPRVK